MEAHYKSAGSGHVMTGNFKGVAILYPIAGFPGRNRAIYYNLWGIDPFTRSEMYNPGLPDKMTRSACSGTVATDF